ncbi:periplasmic binding protein-like I [Obelidium mucronatum]|nr:periplasmic binding protein-like I [Obelidium mucronatum]
MYRPVLVFLLANFTWAAKNQSFITFAIVGPYSWIPGLTYDGFLVVDGYEQINISELSDFDNWGPQTTGLGPWFYFNQLGYTLAIEAINNNPDILPNTTIRIKRFNTEVIGGLGKGHMGGAAMIVAQEIASQHPDVVAVFGEFFTQTTIFSAQVYSHNQLPFCGCTQASKDLLDKNKYPYYIQTMPITGYGETAALLLQKWNVKRIVILTNNRFEAAGNLCYDVAAALKKSDIEIISVIEFVNFLDASLVETQLSKVDARYMFVCTNPEAFSRLYYGLAKLKRFVGPEYVWFSTNIIQGVQNGIELYGKEYYKESRGIMIPTVMNFPSNYSEMLYRSVVENLNQEQSVDLTLDLLDTYTNFAYAYDCANIIGTGIGNLLKSLNETYFEKNQFRRLLNYTLFLNTGYRGVSADPAVLTEFGDITGVGYYGYVDALQEEPNVAYYGETNLEKSKIEFSYAPIFYDGTSNPPADGPRYNISTHDITTLIVLFTLGFLFCISQLVVLVYLSKRKIAKLPSIPFISILTTGSALYYTSLLFYIGTVTVTKCRVRLWLQLTGYVLIMGSMIMKNWRFAFVYLSTEKLSKKVLDVRLWVAPIFVVFGTEQVLVSLWVIKSKLKIGRFIEHSSSKMYSFCSYSSNHAKSATAMLGNALWGFNLLIFVALLCITFKSRNIQSDQSEFLFMMIEIAILRLGAVSTAKLGLDSDGGDPASTEKLYILIFWIAASLPIVIQLFQNHQELLLYNSRKQRHLVPQKVSHPPSVSSQQQQQTSALMAPFVKNDTIKHVKLYRVSACFKTRFNRIEFWSHGAIGAFMVGDRLHIQFLLLNPVQEKQPKVYPIEPLEHLVSIGSITICGDAAWTRVTVSSKKWTGKQVMLDFMRDTDAQEFYKCISSCCK